MGYRLGAVWHELLSFGQFGVGKILDACFQYLVPLFFTACSLDVHKGLDMEGEIYDITTSDSYQQCQKRCTNDKHCHFFTYASETFEKASFRYMQV